MFKTGQIPEILLLHHGAHHLPRQDRVTTPPQREIVVVVVVLWAERGVQRLRQGLQVAAGLATHGWRPSELLGGGG